jgi:hypothetical protein
MYKHILFLHLSSQQHLYSQPCVYAVRCSEEGIHVHLLWSNFELSIPFMSNHKHKDSSPKKIGIAR